MTRIQMRVGIVRVQSQRTRKIAQRLLGAEEPYQHRTAIVGGLCGALIERDRLIEGGHRFGVPIKQRKRNATLEMHVEFTRSNTSARARSSPAPPPAGRAPDVPCRATDATDRRRVWRFQSLIEALSRLCITFQMHERESPDCGAG